MEQTERKDPKEQRKEYTERLAGLMRDTHAVDAAFSFGDNKLGCKDIRILAAPKADISSPDVYKKLNYFISLEMKPDGGEFISKEQSCIFQC